MSKTREPRKHADASAAGEGRGEDSAHTSDANHHEPLKPRRGLFILLAVLLIALFAGFMALYFKTVYHREQPHAAEQDIAPSAHLRSPSK